MIQEFKDEINDVANKYAISHPGISLDNDGSVYDDYDKPFRDFMAGILWALNHLQLPPS